VKVVIDGRELTLSNLDKVLYPRVGFTKGQVLDYYRRIAPVLLPHLRDRPLTLKRYPEGVEGQFFYEKRCPTYRPRWVRTAPIWSDQHGRHVEFCLANDLATLVWAANLADLELHTSLARGRRIDAPTMVVFDLDPGAPADLGDCCEVGLWVKEVCDGLGLVAFAKTSGSKGLQVYVPLNTRVTYDETKPFARAVAQLLEARHPRRVTSLMVKALRPGKVFVDWSQNDAHKTTVNVYSLRARERPTVSTPVDWREVRRAAGRGRASALVFIADEVLARVAARGDLFAPVLTLKQRLPRLRAADAGVHAPG
jgi:bifunctional non-homologous end joining protein LigD